MSCTAVHSFYKAFEYLLNVILSQRYLFVCSIILNPYGYNYVYFLQDLEDFVQGAGQHGIVIFSLVC